ncbi:MAG: D-glycero-beta-D-manno-heptose 1-phosphate adenylyltransferase [Dictyoglomus sp.]|nr:D-glycero-beta-D-manno-heptose 1-phosphate adenylyltransferase [Dictyoglomus sp.]MCX7942301.1 D-glycero-beta-D-manno-heptose 1-phosphate adenylyltransferase [Dictyoglomaceae bacterium]MDW8187877.1 D-glycero-beta-D-manno-heptose 1-phosphate adenylyltransferase [Dictyoglomus sp.]
MDGYSLRKIKNKIELKKIIENLKKQGKIIVFTNGCFELLHPGHIEILEKAKSLGDILIVGINSDNSVKEIKGEKKLILDEKSRLRIISSLEVVDYVVLFDEKTPENLISELKPDIHVKGGDYKIEDLPEAKIVEDYGGKVFIFPLLEGFSTTKIIEKILKLYK